MKGLSLETVAAAGSIWTVLGGIAGYIWGDWDGFIITLLVFIVMDYITGVANAIAHKKLSSAVGFKGIAGKVGILLLVGVAHLLDMNILGGTPVARTMVIFFYLANEGISILENLGALGLPIPEKLREILEQLKKKD